jgi:hypothetical protein
MNGKLIEVIRNTWTKRTIMRNSLMTDIGVRIVFVMIMTNEIVIAKGHENHLMRIEFEKAQDMMIGH